MIMKKELKNKEIMRKQHEQKSLPHYTSEQWKDHWSWKGMLQHVDMKHLKEKCHIGGKDELQ